MVFANLWQSAGYKCTLKKGNNRHILIMPAMVCGWKDGVDTGKAVPFGTSLVVVAAIVVREMHTPQNMVYELHTPCFVVYESPSPQLLPLQVQHL